MQELGDHHKMIKIANNGHRMRRRISSKRNYFTEENNHRRKPPNLGSEKLTQILERHRTPNRQDWRGGFLCHITLSKQSVQNKGSPPKASREKGQATRKDKAFGTIVDFSIKTLKASRVWGKVFWNLKDILVSPAELSTITEGERKLSTIKAGQRNSRPSNHSYREHCTAGNPWDWRER